MSDQINCELINSEFPNQDLPGFVALDFDPVLRSYFVKVTPFNCN